MVFSPFFILGRATAKVPAASNSPLSMVGVVTGNTTSTTATITVSVTAPGSADGIVIVQTNRANGAGVTYAGTCTVDGNSATRIAGNEDTATSDNNVFNIAFYRRMGIASGQSLSISVTVGASSARPGGFVVFFLKNTRPGTTIGASTTARGTTSNATLTGSITPTSTDSIVFYVATTVLGSGTPTVSSFAPSGATDDGLTQMGTTLGGRTSRHQVPADLSAISISTTWSASNTNRGLIALEIVR